MGAGLAKQAKERYDNLAAYWGLEMRDKINSEESVRRFVKVPESVEHLFIGLLLDHRAKLIGFPTKYHWKDKSSLVLIENHLKCLVETKKYGRAVGLDYNIVCPQLGCGLGNLDWVSQVKPLIEKYFGDDSNFVVVSL